MATEVTVRYRFEDDLTAEEVDRVMQTLEYDADNNLPFLATDVELLEVDDA